MYRTDDKIGTNIKRSLRTPKQTWTRRLKIARCKERKLIFKIHGKTAATCCYGNELEKPDTAKKKKNNRWS